LAATADASTGQVVSTVTSAPIPTSRSYSAMVAWSTAVNHVHRMGPAGAVAGHGDLGADSTLYSAPAEPDPDPDDPGDYDAAPI
jgi:hypothetical protein